MSLAIEVKTGEFGLVTLRGCPTGGIEMCEWKQVKNPDTGDVTKELKPFRYYASIEQAFDRVARMRIASFDASTLAELVAGIKVIRADIKKEMGAL